MVKSITKRKTRSDKFPLTLHSIGQYYKKIKGKIYYFATDKQLTLERYFEKAVYLHTGKGVNPKTKSNFSIQVFNEAARLFIMRDSTKNLDSAAINH